VKAEYRIDGNINGSAILGIGEAEIDEFTGKATLEVHFSDRPRAWDPRTLLLMCCSRAPAMASCESGEALSLLRLSGGLVTIGKELEGVCRRAALVDSNGRLVADVSALSETSFGGSSPFDRSTLLGRYADLEPGVSGIAEIHRVSGVMLPVGPHMVSLTTQYEVTLETGVKAHGFTHYPHYLPRPAEPLLWPQAFRLDVLSCEWHSNVLYLATRSFVSRISLDFSTSIEVGTVRDGNSMGHSLRTDARISEPPPVLHN